MNRIPDWAPDTPATAADIDLFRHLEEDVYTAVVSDALDELGFRHQAMRERLRPLQAAACFAGWAHTIACSDVYHVPEHPYDMEIAAVDAIQPGAAVVISTQNSKRNAPWGELLSTASKARQARGAVVDGLVRDVKKIEDLGFPVFAAGIKPVDSMGRGTVTHYNVPIECGEVKVNPGDLVFADFDGVIVIPRRAVADAVRLADEKVAKENQSRAELMRGAYLRDVYKKYGVL